MVQVGIVWDMFLLFPSCSVEGVAETLSVLPRAGKAVLSGAGGAKLIPTLSSGFWSRPALWRLM